MNNKEKNLKTVLISGGGIAGLALAIQLKKKGWQPEVVEIAESPRLSGYTMDLFGTGWDVAKRMGILDKILALPKPIKAFEMHDTHVGRYARMSIKNIHSLLKNYTYVRRPDLEMILREEAIALGITIHDGVSITDVKDTGNIVKVKLDNGDKRSAELLIGADGVNSNVRSLVFGKPQEFERFLGLYIAGFEVRNNAYTPDDTFSVFEGTNHQAICYPGARSGINALFVLRSEELPRLSSDEILSFVKDKISKDSDVSKKIINDPSLSKPVYFSPVTQIEMPQWHKGRVALIGDANGCLTFLSGQGSHMALAGAYILAEELEKHGGDFASAFDSYQRFLRPHIEAKQDEARKLVKVFVPHASSKPWLRRLIVRCAISLLSLKLVAKFVRIKSVLDSFHSK